MKNQRSNGMIWMIMGLLLLLATLFLTVYNIWDGKRAELASMEEELRLESYIPEAQEYEERMRIKAQQNSLNWDDSETEEDMIEALVLDDDEYIGILEIPVLSLRLPVRLYETESGLKNSPCRMSGTIYGNDLVIAAHNYRKHFSQIKWMPMGSEVILRDVDGVIHRYTAESTEILNPDQVQEMMEGDWDLTMFTCTTGGQTRYAVRCKRKEK